MLTLSRHSFKNSKERLRTEIQHLLAEQRTSGENEGLHSETFLSKLHNARNGTGQNQLSREEVEGMMITMIFAGYETTASVLVFVWYALATHLDLQEAFHNELDAVLDGDVPTQVDIDELEFTHRILKETMRLYPPIHTIPRQKQPELLT